MEDRAVADMRDELMKQYLTGVVLALELLARPDYPQERRARHAEMGLTLARKLARILQEEGTDTQGAPEAAT
jgi:hypothetical protein